MTERVYIVMLRQPRRSDPNEMRSDPFWEFGSFGCTGCHSKNLLNRKGLARLEGARLAFAQGGRLGFRLVFVTPPVRVNVTAKYVEARWSPAGMPFRYADAPLLIDNHGGGDFHFLRNHLVTANRPTWAAKFASRFRARTKPLSPAQSEEVIAGFEAKLNQAKPNQIAAHYVDALPFKPQKVDATRSKTLRQLRGETNERRPDCRPAPCKRTAGKSGIRRGGCN